jgi:alpha-L-rhamnosidase
MFQHMAGIMPNEEQPGFKHFFLQPNPDTRNVLRYSQKRITEVDADFASDYGQIKAEWQCDGTKEMTYQITIPANTSATLRLPTGDGLYIYEGARLAEEADGVQYIGTSEGYATYNVGSGSYVFMVSTEDPTSIKSVDESASLTGNQREKVFYSLDGKQLPNDSVHGIVITEGKKKIVK